MLSLKCLPCTDRAIETGPGDAAAMLGVPEAVTMAPLAQAFNAGGQTIMAINVVPVCGDCRKEQLKAASSRLAIA